jgi:NTE family protein
MFSRVFLIILSLIIPWFSNAQKVGLVLSGGGAKGLAHIGVIKALEEKEIPIDFIAGTSMGAIVGGLYAAGYSASEIEKVVLSEEFLNWVNGREDPAYNYYFNKREDNPSFVSVDLKLDSTLSATIASNLANDQIINMILAEWLAQASELADYNFDSLFVPLRVMAADIFTQTEVVIKDGTLNEALRASLTVPLFYRPIQVKGRYLYDGGIYNNFPVDVMIEDFNPDVIIGSNVSIKKFEDYPFAEADKLVNNAILFSVLNNSDVGKLREQDIYIEPDLSSFTPFDFNRAKEMIDSGYLATLNHIDKIRTSVAKLKPEEEVEVERENFRKKYKPLSFGGLRFEGISKRQQSYVSRQFNLKKDYLNLEEIKKGYYRLVGQSYFMDIFPNMIYDRELQSYFFELRGKPRRAFKVQLGGAISTRQVSNIFLEGRFYHFNRVLFDHSALFYAGSFYQSAAYRSRISFPLGIQFYLEPELIYNHWDYLGMSDFFINASSPTAILQTDRKYGLNLGFPVGSKFKAVIQASHYNNDNLFGNNRDYISSDTLDRVKLKGYRYAVEISRNSLNRKQYPNSGSRLFLGFDYFLGDEFYEPGNTSVLNVDSEQFHEWYRLKLTAESYFKLGRFSPGYVFETVVTNQPFLTNYTGTLIAAPAFSPNTDSKTLFIQNFRSHSYIAGGLRNVITVARNIELRMEGYVFKAFRKIVEAETQLPGYDNSIEHLSFSAAVGFVYHSPLGPVSLGGNYYDDPETQFTVMLHLGYLLFNKRSWD